MAKYLSPFTGHQFADANGNPYSGAKLFTYEAGTSTKVTTYKDINGASSHANPIVLNTRGEPADGSGVTYPIFTDGGTNIKYVLAPSTDTDPPVSAIETFDNIPSVNDVSTTLLSWVPGPAPTHISATSFSVAGDYTDSLHIGRRTKTTNTGGTIYSTVTAVSYGSSITTITVVNDSGTLDSGLDTMSYGLIPAVNTNLPAAFRLAALTIQGAQNYTTASGTDTYISTHSPSVLALVTGAEFNVKFTNANTSATPTWNPDTLGAKTIKRLDGSALLVGDIAAVGQHVLRYDGTDMLLLNPRHVLRDEEIGAATATTQALGTSNTTVATTAFVANTISDGSTTPFVGTKCFGMVNAIQAQTQYLGAVGVARAVANNTETNYEFWPSEPVTISSLYARESALCPAGQSAVFTVRKNGANTSITATVNSSVQQASDIANSVDIWPGDRFSIQVVTSATYSSVLDLTASIKIVKKNSTAGANMIMGSSALGGYGEFGGITVVERAEQFMPNIVIGREISDSIISGASSIYRNGAATGYIGVDNQNYYFNGSSDLMTINTFTKGCATLYPTKAIWGNFPGKGLLFFSSDQQPQATTYYMGGWALNSNSTVETDVEVPITAGTIKNLRVCVSAAPPAGQPVTFTLRKNGVDTAITCQITSAGRTASDLSNTVAFVAGDLLSIKCVTSATTGTLSYNANVEHVI